MAEKEKRFKHVQTERELTDVAGCIGNNWEMLGPFLGVSPRLIQEIKTSFPGQAAIQIYYMLLTWKNVRKTDATVENLLAALHKAPTSVHINWSRMNDISFTRRASSYHGHAENVRNSAGSNRSGDQSKSALNPATGNVRHPQERVPIVYPAITPDTGNVRHPQKVVPILYPTIPPDTENVRHPQEGVPITYLTIPPDTGNVRHPQEGVPISYPAVPPDTGNVRHQQEGLPISYPAIPPNGWPGQAYLTRPVDKAVLAVTEYSEIPPTGTVTRGESNLPLGAGGGGEGSPETIHSSLFPNASGNTRKQGKDEINLQAVDKSYSMNSPDGPIPPPQDTTAGNSIIYLMQPQGENRNGIVDTVRNDEAENNDVQDQHGGRPPLPDQPNLGAPRNYAQSDDGIKMVEEGLQVLELTKSGNQPSGSSNVTAVVQKSADSRQNDETDARGEFKSIAELADGELRVKREKLKPDVPAAPHDGRLLTPRVEMFKAIIEQSVDPTQKGGFGDVFFYKDKIPGLNIPAVVKRINCKGYPKHKMMSITNERLASRTMHFSIVPLLAMTEDVQNNTFYFLTPYLEKGDLADAIRNDTSKINNRNKDVMLKSGDRVRILYQINSALQFLHTPIPGFRGIIVHMDLKTLNIVLDCKLNARLIDFGLAREMNETDTSLHVTATEVPGTKGYYQTVQYDRLTPKEDYHNFGIGMT